MQATEKEILGTLFHKDALQEVEKKRLEELAAKYPFFGVGWYLLAKQNAAQKIPDQKHIAQKAMLHFSDALWLQYNLYPVILEFAKDLPIHPPTLINEEEEQKDLEQHEETSEETLVSESDLQLQSEKIAGVLKDQLEEFEKPVEDAELELQPQEPYYKVDYFASQGIKLEAARENNHKERNDRVDVKLQSFTDWLKQMKRTNPKPTDLGTETAMETLVQHTAESSNETQEVITESMAEILLKQGKTGKAIEVYNKLSFLNPSKSTYFAAKIQELNK